MSRVRVLVGTRKGAFVLTSDGQRRRWRSTARTFAGWEVYHVKGSPADPDRIYASQTSGWFGQIIQRSDDGGTTWHQPGTPPGEPTTTADGMPKGESNKFAYDVSPRDRPAPDDAPALRRHAAAPGVQARVASRALLAGREHGVRGGRGRGASSGRNDGGLSWHELAGLRGHGTGPQWQPGAGGMCLHTILLDPSHADRIFIGHLVRGRVPVRRRRRDLEAHQPRPALRAHPRPHGRGRPLRPPHRDAPVAAERALHAEALGRDAHRRRRRVVARDQRQPADRLRVRGRRPRARARDDLRRCRSRATRSTSRPTGSSASTAAATGGNEWEALTERPAAEATAT